MFFESWNMIWCLVFIKSPPLSSHDIAYILLIVKLSLTDIETDDIGMGSDQATSWTFPDNLLNLQPISTIEWSFGEISSYSIDFF